MSTAVIAEQRRRATALGTEALYRVVSVRPPHAIVEVIDVPGMPQGARLRLALEAVAEMEVVDRSLGVDAELARLATPRT